MAFDDRPTEWLILIACLGLLVFAGTALFQFGTFLNWW
jgi:hypothetical protein